MKTSIIFILITLCLNCAAFYNTISVYYNLELKNLSITMMDEYSNNFSDIYLDIKSIDNYTKDKNDIILFSHKNDIKENSFKTLIGKEIMVFIINNQNKSSDKLLNNGISSNDIKNMIINDPNKFIISNNTFVYNALKDFMNDSEVNIDIINKINSSDIYNFMNNNPDVIGVCRLSDVIELEQVNFSSINVIPIDKNNNGNLDSYENIYQDINNFKRGVWIGKYPKSLINYIYVSTNNISNNNIQNIFKWEINEGQQYLWQHGINELISNEKRTELNKLISVEKDIIDKKLINYTKIFLFIIISTIILFGILFYLYKLKLKKHKMLEDINITRDINKDIKTFNNETLIFPDGIFYDKTHTWVFMEKDGTIQVGIDDFIQHITGDYTGLEFKKIGEKIRKNEVFVTLVQNGKKLNIHSPISGEIISINKDIIDFPNLINNSPYFSGWIYSIKPIRWKSESKFLEVSEQYKEWIKNEFIRLKDIFSNIINPEGILIYQDGGELIDNMLQDYGPIIWEEFQEQFIN